MPPSSYPEEGGRMNNNLGGKQSLPCGGGTDVFR